MGFDKNRIIEIITVDSTTLYAERLIKEHKVEEGTTIWAHAQSAGKGQGENIWISEPGKNLTMSMIFYPRFLSVDCQFLLNKTVSLGVLDFIHTLLPFGSCKLKWPNDIYSGSLKLGGILIINTITGPYFDTSIIGIGININQVRFDPVIPNPSSIRLLTGRSNDIGESMLILAEKVDYRYQQLKSGNIERLDIDYRDNLLGYNQKRKFSCVAGNIEGFIRDVDPFGRLIVETPDNKRLTFSYKEVELLL